MNRPRWLLLAGFMLFALLACRVEMHTTFKTPESGHVRLGWTMTAEEEQMLQNATDSTAEELCNELAAEIGDDDPQVSVTFDSTEEERSCVVEGPFDNLDQLAGIYGEDTTINKIGEEDGKFYYDVVASPLGDAADLGIPIEVTWSVTMPGKVLEHNGDALQGRTVVWHLDGTEPVHMQAVSKVGGIDAQYVALAVGCLCLPLLLAAIGVAAWLVLRKGKGAPPTPQGFSKYE